MKSLFIAGNWKSNKTAHEAIEWVSLFHREFAGKQFPTGLTAVICAPFTALASLNDALKNTKLPLGLGAQDVSAYDDGAYTGEVSARQVGEFAQWVIIGHSERRHHQRETDDELAQKVGKAKAADLHVIYCVPDAQTVVPAGVDVVAYEPVWAIGTGKADTPDNANGVCGQIQASTHAPLVIYGGSVTDQNVVSFVSMPHIDGVLPGAASLDARTFFRLLMVAGQVIS